ncbi:MAG TPA: metal ABC transporter substrate-binding protein, partial [Gaiellaceae bacterium]|nr:metal ABC transporter substrate-binding protein [Gaiellaceae bacterium]
MRTVPIWAAAVALLAGCGSAAGSDGKRSVVAAFYPLAYAAEQIGGSSVDVTNLTPPGAEPHDLELTPREVGRIQSADVVLYLSHGFQPAVEQAVGGAHGTRVDVLRGLGVAEHGADPHVWLDPTLYARVVRRVGAALGRPRRAAALAARLLALDRAYRDGLEHCRRREFVTSHAAFGRLAARYRLRQVSIGGIDPEYEPSPRRLQALIELVRREHVSTVFFEPLFSPRLA